MDKIQKTAEFYKRRIALLLYDTYTTDDGATEFKGQSLSHVVDELRFQRIKMPSGVVRQIGLLEYLGFKVVKARGRRIYAGGKENWGVPCNCVTLDTPRVPKKPDANDCLNLSEQGFRTISR